jgi:hypothetical protein
MSMSLKEFLSTVDDKREPRFVDCMVSLLGQIDILELEHLQIITFADLEFAEKPSAGKMGFLRAAMSKCAVKPSVGGAPEDGEIIGSGLSRQEYESGLLRLLGKEQKPVHEHIDMGVKLAEENLLVHIPSAVWPHTNAVCKLNKKVKALQKSGQEVASVAVDLCE